MLGLPDQMEKLVQPDHLDQEAILVILVNKDLLETGVLLGLLGLLVILVLKDHKDQMV